MLAVLVRKGLARARRETVTAGGKPIAVYPAAEVIGGDNDPFWFGWLLVTINASDIAASGARPEAFLAALDLPRDYPVALFERLLNGIQTSCRANALRYVGGNIREAHNLAAVGTAIGSSPKPPLGRNGAQPGDHIVILGKSGRFWADVFKHRAGRAVDKSTVLCSRRFHRRKLFSRYTRPAY